MSRKAIIVCTSVIIVLLIGIAAAVSVLYSGTGSAGKDGLDDARFDLYHAVPSDAVAVLGFGEFEDLVQMLAGNGMPSSPFMGKAGKSVSLFSERLSGMKRMPAGSSPAVLSIHYAGELVPLIIIDAGKSGDGIPDEAAGIIAAADSAGLYSAFVDCHDIVPAGSCLSRRSIVLASVSDLAVKSAQRHLSRNISVIDAEGFVQAAAESDGDDMLFVSGRNIGKIFSSFLTRKYSRYADFFSDVFDWAALSMYSYDRSHAYLKGPASFVDGDADFMKVFESVSPSVSEVSSVLPSYTVFAATVPMADCQSYIDAHERFMETGSGTVRLMSGRKSLEKKTGISPEDWASALGVKEAATASFYAGSSLEQVVLVRVSGRDIVPLLFKGTDVSSIKDYVPKVHPYAYSGYASSLFGSMFDIGDEDCFTYIDGWIVSGNAVAVGEYVSGRALENSLKEYMADAGLPDRMSGKDRFFSAYFSVTGNMSGREAFLSGDFAESLASYVKDVTYCPVTLSVDAAKSSAEISLELDKVTVTKSKAPVFERDTVVTVSKGPFRVKNSGTGRMNLFYQQDNLYLCLQEENGKGIWGAPFKSPICGRAGTIDYFANGKLQILFASGSSLYLIDRLGRFVNPFPVNLGKEILLGPDIYDFNNSRRYNVMVLHTDNTVDMYNLQGRKPLQWKGITAAETIKGLPEPVKVGGRTYWVVRTSIQTLIFPFYGGEPLTTGEGDRMIRTDSKVIPGKDNTVTVTCYDGKEHRLKL